MKKMHVWRKITEMWDTLIGVLGTLAGTILGWLLNELARMIGKVDVKSSNIIITPSKLPKLTTETKILSLTISFELTVKNEKRTKIWIEDCQVFVCLKNGKEYSKKGSLYSNENKINKLNGIFEVGPESHVIKTYSEIISIYGTNDWNDLDSIVMKYKIRNREYKKTIYKF